MPEIDTQLDVPPEAAPHLIPGLTPDEAARRFLVALQAAARTDPLAHDVLMVVAGLAPLAPAGQAPVQVRWAPERTMHADSVFPA